MNDVEARVVEYQITYNRLTADFKEKCPCSYNLMISYLKVEKIKEGFYAKRINKANKKGTSITFAAVDSVDVYNEEIAKVSEDIKKVTQRARFKECLKELEEYNKEA